MFASRLRSAISLVVKSTTFTEFTCIAFYDDICRDSCRTRDLFQNKHHLFGIEFLILRFALWISLHAISEIQMGALALEKVA